MQYITNGAALIAIWGFIIWLSIKVDRWVGEDEKWRDFFGTLILGCVVAVAVVSTLFFIGNMIPYSPPPDSVQVDLSEFFNR